MAARLAQQCDPGSLSKEVSRTVQGRAQPADAAHTKNTALKADHRLATTIVLIIGLGAKQPCVVLLKGYKTMSTRNHTKMEPSY